jgi:hypothetical protein
MRGLNRRGIAGPVARTLAAIGAVTAVLLSMVVFAFPASAKTDGPTYRVIQILSGSSLHHWYTPYGSRKLRREPLTQPDDITRLGGDMFTAFQNGIGPQGQASSDGNRFSTIVEYTLSGAVLRQWDVKGHCDGLTADPATGLVVATVNEDLNSSLFTIDPSTGQVVHYAYNKNPLPHNGGTDAIEFYDGLMLISASAPGTIGAPAPRPNYPAVYSVTLNQANRVAYVQALFYDESDATAANGPHAGETVRLGLTDPDSNEDVPFVAPRFAGDFMLTSQGDKEQIYVRGAGTRYQHLSVLDLSQSVDDTAWATARHGAFYTTDNSDGDVYAVIGTFQPGTVFVAVTPCDANNAPATCPAPGFPPHYLGQLNMFTGQITPVSLRGPRLENQGMVFVPL